MVGEIEVLAVLLEDERRLENDEREELADELK